MPRERLRRAREQSLLPPEGCVVIRIRQRIAVLIPGRRAKHFRDIFKAHHFAELVARTRRIRLFVDGYRPVTGDGRDSPRGAYHQAQLIVDDDA